MRGRTAAIAAVAVLFAGALAIVGWRRAHREIAAPQNNSAKAQATGAGAAANEPRWSIVLSSGRADDAAAAAGGELSGRVLSSATGAGVAKAQLNFLHEGALFTASGDGEGNFIFRAPSPGRYELTSASAPNFLPFAVEFGHSPIALTARAGVRVRDVTLYLAPAIAYTGVVEAADGKPVAGAEVRRLSPLEGEPETFSTDARGEFSFHAADEEMFEARHPRFGRGRAVLDGEAQRSHRLVIALAGIPDGGAAEPNATATISGSVVDERGAPIEGALVIADAHGRAPRPERQATSRGDGRFTVENLDAGADYRVSARARGLIAEAQDHVPAGAADVKLILRAGGGVRGVVRDAATGKPLAAFSVVAVEKRGALERGAETSISVFDAEGRYELRGLAPGAYAVTALAHGHAPAREQTIELTGTELAQADFSLGTGGRLFGVVRDAGGAPLPGARVSLEGAASLDGAPVGTQASTTSDGAGRFELRGLSPGLHSIFVAAEAHHARILSGLSLDENGDLGPLTVDLSPTAPGEAPTIEIVGIGAVLVTRGDAMEITATVAGGGAAEAGLVAGDAIVTIDGLRAVDLGFGGAVEHIRGPENSQVTLGVRKKDGSQLDLVVTRRRVTAPR